MPVELVVDDDVDDGVPSAAAFASWLRALEQEIDDPRLARHVCVRICGEAESQKLNAEFRGKNQPTNVLSFPSGDDPGPGDLPLGDLAICWPLVCAEARAQGKATDHHLAHLTVHGVLHLLGFDHEGASEAAIMERLEVSALARLGIADPYD